MPNAMAERKKKMKHKSGAHGGLASCFLFCFLLFATEVIREGVAWMQ
jgi:hypothetical protein